MVTSLSELVALSAVDWPVASQSRLPTTSQRVMQGRVSAMAQVGAVCSDQRLIPLAVRP